MGFQSRRFIAPMGAPLKVYLVVSSIYLEGPYSALALSSLVTQRHIQANPQAEKCCQTDTININ